MLLPPWLRLLLIGDTGAGKTAQIGLLAEYIAATEDKKTVVFTMDKGGTQSIRPHLNLGIIELIMYDKSIPPWVWITKSLRGEAKVNGRWVKVIDPTKHGLAAYEGLTAFSESMMMDLSRHSAENPTQAVGGESAWSFSVRDDEQEVRMASNTQSHYGLAQMQLMREIWEADPGVLSLYTALLARGSDALAGGGMLSPQTVGNKQGPMVPRWFDFVARLDAVPSSSGPLRHLLYLETHLDKNAKGAKVVANARIPIAGSSKVDAVIEPADIVKALLQVNARGKSAEEEIKERMARIRGSR